MSQLELKDKVVVIVDASSELGQACASLFAARGSRLVVNYPPTRRIHRPGKNEEVNASCRGPIEQKEGHVAITYEHVYDGDKIIAAAIARFNSVHMLINNAVLPHSIGLDTFDNNVAWDLMRQAILKGTFRAVKAVWPHFRKQKSGCVIQAACLGPQTGVAESSANFALIGLIQTLAKEGAKYNIFTHFVTPKAASSTTRTGEISIDTTMIPRLSSLVIELCQQSNSKTSGAIFECDEEGVSKLQWQRASGILLNPDVNFTASALLREWSEIDEFSDSTYPTEAMDFAELLPKAQALAPKQQFDQIKFDGKVVIVTGAGSGLGRSYALAFADAGASVIVNDRADPRKVVEEIQSRGGKATSCIASVESGEFIVKSAMNAYGHVDIIINNAGFLRDKAFINMDEATWDVILNVHLNGTYQMTKAVWPHFVKQGYGRIVNTSSTSGVYGNFGQANYSAAKLGILGLSDAAARLGLQHNIHVNTIAPVASTAALNQSMSADNKNNQTGFKPEYVAPIVVALSMDKFQTVEHPTGSLFEVGCGWHARTRLRPRSHHEEFSPQNGTEQNLLASTDLTQLHRENHFEKLSGGNTETAPNLETSANTVPTNYVYSDKDVILYNLAVGAKRTDLRFVYENAKDFQPVPTFGMIPFFSPSVISQNAELVPNFKPTLSLLGEHYLEILEYPIPTSGSLSSTRTIVEVVDKDSAAISITGYDTIDLESGAKLFYNEVSFFMRGSGGFGGRRQPRDRGHTTRRYTVPSTPPDVIVEYQTSEEQAALYRLTGDRMAMHIDPEFSQRGGFDIPILHGACFMGIAGKHVFETYGAFRSIKVRFAGVVFPGQTLKTEMWKDKMEPGLVLFQMRVIETGGLCIAGGGAHLWEKSSLARL